MSDFFPTPYPDTHVDAKKCFGVSWQDKVPAFKDAHPLVPALDPHYAFDPEVTRAVLAGFTHNKRVLVYGYHGTGKSTHIEQVAARLNWPCIRINLDGNLTRIDLVGKDAIVLHEGKQVTEFKEGIIPWAIQRPIVLILDEYDAARPDVLFVLQRLLEQDGKFTLIDQNRVITPHPYFRLFATANTSGMGDALGIYHGTQPINQGQMDRWSIVARQGYLPYERELKVVQAKVPGLAEEPGGETLMRQMVLFAGLTRQGFIAGDISSVMSPRTVIAWAENILIFGDKITALALTFLNKCEESEQGIIEEYYQRCFEEEMTRQSK